MSNKSNALNYSNRVICPWCGKLRLISDTSVDHVFPKSEWGAIRYSAQFKEFMLKGCKVIIPNWSPYGDFRFWEVRCLFEYATYLHFWCDMFIAYYSYKIISDEDDYGCMFYKHTRRRICDELVAFKDEYSYRVRTNNWYMDNV